MAFTAPQPVAVVIEAKIEELAIPNRTSFPSMLPNDGSTPSAVSRGLPCASAHQQTRMPTTSIPNMLAHTAQPWRWFLTIRPR